MVCCHTLLHLLRLDNCSDSDGLLPRSIFEPNKLCFILVTKKLTMCYYLLGLTAPYRRDVRDSAICARLVTSGGEPQLISNCSASNSGPIQPF